MRAKYEMDRARYLERATELASEPPAFAGREKIIAPLDVALT